MAKATTVAVWLAITGIALVAQGCREDEQNRPLGIVKVSGILRFLVEHFPKVVYTLPPKPHHITQEREGA